MIVGDSRLYIVGNSACVADDILLVISGIFSMTDTTTPIIYIGSEDITYDK